MKRMLMILLMISLIIGIGGCIGNEKEESVSKEEAVEALKNEAMDYLSKYDDEFEPVSFTLQNVMEHYHTLVVHSKKYNTNFNVYIYEDEKDKFKDNYILLDLTEPGSEYMNTIVRKFLPNAVAKIRILSLGLNEYKDGIEDFEDFYNSDQFIISLYIFDSTISFEDKSKLNSLIEEMKSKKKSMRIIFVQSRPVEDLEYQVKNQSISELLQSDLKLKSLNYTIKKNGEIEEGTIENHT
ncbi:hypothetical protein H9636_09445 [Ureibacillus sp. Re31]|uniref:Lipoprotein n=1 Tax=Ureibacillus galli TaxID=2762222 RepID=A0ABR8XCD1_9BACL|nr:hypothetical protein [Ureibacillus galli]MBD8026883.1 hypothetical protein [Ureibacillus galli]